MKNTKLIHLFKALKINELKEFIKFIKSPFYNKNLKVISLFEYLKKHKNDLEGKKIDKAYVFKRVFPKGEDYADWKMRELMSDLSKLIEEYFIQKEAQQNHIDRQMLLIKSLEKREVDTYFFRYAKGMKEEIDAVEVKTMDHYLAQLKLQHLLFYHPATSTYDKDSRERLLNIMYNTDMFYSLAKLRYGYEIAIWKRMRGEVIEGFISSEVLEQLPENVVSDNLLLSIYQLSNQLYKTRRYETYGKMKKAILNNLDLFNKEEAYNVLTLLINSVTLVVHSEKVANEVLSLYKIGLERGLFISGNRFIIGHFNNIISLSCRVGKYEWTQDFINKYYMYLPAEEDKKENIRTLYMARLNFLRKRYEEVERILNTLEFEDVSYGLRHYVLLVKSLYELERAEVFDKCNAFKLYIFRKNKARFISHEVHQEYANFIRLVTQIASIRGEVFKKEDGIHKLLEKVNTMRMLTERIWLTEKLKELIKGSV